MTVAVLGAYNLVAYEYDVFGLRLSNLTECDLPATDEQVGVILQTKEEIADCIDVQRAAMGYGPRHHGKPQ